MSKGIKHLIRCRCVMPQFKTLPEPPVHQFVVFSILQDDDTMKPKFSQCNNCGVIHKIVDVCRSEIVPSKDSMNSLISVDDVRVSMPSNLANILDKNNADLSTWELAQFIYENKRWGEFAVLNTDSEGSTRQGKYIVILGENLFKVESFSREEYAREKK